MLWNFTGAPHSSNAVSPAASLVSFGSTRKSSRSTAKKKVQKREELAQEGKRYFIIMIFISSDHSSLLELTRLEMEKRERFYQAGRV